MNFNNSTPRGGRDHWLPQCVTVSNSVSDCKVGLKDHVVWAIHLGSHGYAHVFQEGVMNIALRIIHFGISTTA